LRSQKGNDVFGFGLPENELNLSFPQTGLLVEIGQCDVEVSIGMNAAQASLNTMRRWAALISTASMCGWSSGLHMACKSSRTLSGRSSSSATPWLNNTDTRPEKRISPFDHTLRFVAAVNYDLPVGRGKLLNVESRWLDEIVGGWRLNGIYTYQTGAPLLFLNGSSNNPGDYPLCSVTTVKGSCPNGPNGVPLAATFLDPTSLNLNAQQTNGSAFDTTHFVTPTGQQFAFHIRTLPTTFSALRQDAQNNLDASVIKKFDVTERTYFQFRFEAFNVLNHAVFGAPNMSVTNSQFGVINTTANRPRQIQVGARFVF
jgi:hypothetical protein